MTDAFFPSRTAGNENKEFIKITAYALMLVDHIGVVFFPRIFELRILGRIAFPLFAWGICVGAEYTRNIWKYALRLLLVGLISQPGFMYGMNHPWNHLNVYATLLLGLLGIAAIRENKLGSRYWGPALAVLAACAVRMDYGFQGVLFILLLYGSRKNRSAIAMMMIAYCLYWGYGTQSIKTLLGWTIPLNISFLPYGSKLIADLTRVEFSAIWALPIILLPMRSKKGARLPNWLGYTVYPAHMLLFAAIRHWGEIIAFLGI